LAAWSARRTRAPPAHDRGIAARSDAPVDSAVRLLRDAIEEFPDRLVVDLRDVTAIDAITISVLLAGYLAAADAGIRYQVINARRKVRRRLVAAGVARILADSDDVDALFTAAGHPPSWHAADPRHLSKVGLRASRHHPSTPGSPLPRHRLTTSTSPGPGHRRGVVVRCRCR
jgi:anti-anti-sigma regulatory factor